MSMQRERRVPVNPHHAKLSRYLHQKSICCCCWWTTMCPSSVRHDESHKGCAMLPKFAREEAEDDHLKIRYIIHIIPDYDQERENCEISCCAFICTIVLALSVVCTVCGSQWASTRKCEVVFRWAAITAWLVGTNERLGDRLCALIEYLWPLKSNRISAIHK